MFVFWHFDLALMMGMVVYTNGSDHFVLRNSSVQLTISDGRITSLLDVKLEYVFMFLMKLSLKLTVVNIVENSSPLDKREDWSYSKIALITGMHGVRRVAFKTTRRDGRAESDRCPRR